MSFDVKERSKYEFFYRNLKGWVKRSELNMYFLRVGSDLSKKLSFEQR